MKKPNKLTGVFALLLASMLFITSCGGGGGASSSGDGSFDGSADESPDLGDASDTPLDGDTPADSGTPSDVNIPVDGSTPTGNPVNTGVDTPVVSLSFNLTGAVGLAIDNSPVSSGSSALTVTGGGSSNLKRVNPDNSLSDAVRTGSVKVQSFMVAANNQIYLLLTSPVDSCILIRVNGDTNETSCVDSTLSQIGWNNSFGDPIQFDGEGNVYYKGSAGGKTILRVNASGTTTDLINDYISLSGFLVLYDGTVIIAGNTSSTGTSWTRIVTPAGSIQNFLPGVVPSFLTLFPDNNVYVGNAGGFTIARYLTATEEFDSRGWIGTSADTAYFTCPTGISCSPGSILRTTDGKVYIENGNLVEYYPAVAEANTTVSTVTISKGILTYIVLAGFDSDDINKLVLYNTDTDSETDLMGSENIEVYHLNYLNSGGSQIVMFDGLRFSDNHYVLCQVDLTDNNALTCSLTGTGKLTDFQLFDNTDTIAGGGTNSTKTYTIGGTVSGLDGTLVLQDNGNDTLTLTEDGSFTFPIAVVGDYDVTIQAQPEGQTCTVTEGSGTVSDHHVTSVSVVCVGYTIGGTVTGLIGTLDLANNESDSLRLIQNGSFDGSFVFSNTMSNAASYNVTVTAHPIGQTCNVSQGSGTIAEHNVTSVSVACSTNPGAIVTLVAGLNGPTSVVLGVSGNLYFTDGCRIRRIDTDGIITAVAGNGSCGYSGDGGEATSARLNGGLKGLAVDSYGNLYIADPSNHRIRKVDTNGIIATIAGTGVPGSWKNQGDGSPPAITAQLNSPIGLALDSSDTLYFSDAGNAVVAKIDTSGEIQSITGQRSLLDPPLSYPMGITFDASGKLYVAETGNHRIGRIDAYFTPLTTIAGRMTYPGYSGDGSLAILANLYSPSGVVFDFEGNLYIADTNNHRIRRVDTGGVISSVVGSGIQDFSGDGGLAVNAALNSPQGVAIDSSGNLYIADTGNNRIRMVAGE